MCSAWGKSPVAQIQSPSFRSAGKCREWPWSSVPCLCPLGWDYLGTGWSGRSAGQVQLGQVGISPEGGSQRESGCRVVGERHEKPHLPRGSDPSGLRDGTSLPGWYLKAFRMPFLRGPSLVEIRQSSPRQNLTTTVFGSVYLES